MQVAPDEFVAAMTQRWQHDLHNVPSENLKAVWRQLCNTFNRQIQTHGTPEGQRWRVLQPATGTGKTQGLALYCAMLPNDDHRQPGVLIVTRLKVQAEEIANTINELSGCEGVAVACHSTSDVPASALTFHPVVVITHRAFEIGLDAVNRAQDTDRSNWSAFMAWNGDGRRLVVIDEALDIVEESQVDIDQVRRLQAAIPFVVASEHPKEMALLALVERILVKMDAIAKEQASAGRTQGEQLLKREAWPADTVADLGPLRRALKGLRLDRTMARTNDTAVNQRIIKEFDAILKHVEITVSTWNWYAKKMATHTINAARLIVPDDATGAVVLDATASSNLIYDLFDEKVDVIPVPTEARRYDNVTLHVSTGHAVGKTSMVKRAKAEAPKLLANLHKNLPKDRRVFTVCHKWVEPQLVSIDHQFDVFDVGHWGAIDGRNDWDEHDTVVIFGLPYRDRVWSANTFMALQGVQTTDWLQAEGDRPFKNLKDIRHALEVGQLVVNVVQAVNRVRCRRVIDSEGNCAPTDVFILLPNDRTGTALLDGLKREMPGVNVVKWEYDKAPRKARRSNHEEAVIRYASGMMPGRTSASTVKSDLSISPTSWERLAKKLRDTSASISERLAEAGVRYVVEGQGRGSRSYLVKG